MHSANVRFRECISVHRQVVDDVADSAELWKRAVRDFLSEILLRETCEFDHIQRVCFEVFDEARAWSHLGQRAVSDFGNQSDDFGFD